MRIGPPIMLASLLLQRPVASWMVRRSFTRTPLTRLRDTILDDQGRRVRRPRDSNDGWDDFDPMAAPSPPIARERSRAPDRRPRREGPPSTPRGRSSNPRFQQEAPERKINMKALEGAGFVHLYGIASVLNALEANRRDFTRPEDLIDLDSLTGEEYEHERQQRERKPEAQFTPWLFVQEQKGRAGRSLDKSQQVDQAIQLAAQRGIPVAHVDKGILNTLSGNRPHQGLCLRCGKLDFDSITRIPNPREDPSVPSTWLVLDEVVDPQNLGALLRSAYFLGGHSVGVLVCAKNSAPPSPTVSAASAGALELADVVSTSNLPRTLAAAEQDGFRIIGASASIPPDLDIPLYDLETLPKTDQPTLLVLGSEGHGLRSLVARSCTDLVRIPGAEGADGVDSLNVSVTGGILLWHVLQQRK